MTALAPRRSGPTPDQVAAANPAASAWVNASAGSGKTFVLARRVLRLLRQGVAPGRILCLTFTRAAAAEMARRVFLELGRWTTLTDADLTLVLEDLEDETPDAASLARARRLFAEALETPGGLKIQTIHAFAERVLHRFPFEANVPAHFEVLDDATAAELRARSQGEVLAAADSQPGGMLARALDTVAACTSDAGFFDLLGKVIASRGALSRWIGERGGLEPALEQLASLLGADAGGDAATMRAGLFDATLFPAARWPAAIEILNGGSKQDQDRGADLARALAAAGALRDAAALTLFFTQKEKPRARLMTKALAGAHPELADTLAAEQARLAALLASVRAQESFEASAALFRLSHAILVRYGDHKRAAGMLDYEDLIAAMLALVTRRAAAQWVLYKLDGGIDHILIDEAQDTSPAQWTIVAALAEEALSGMGAHEGARTIFAVGDEKQSIYSFQGADPEKFDEMRRFFARRSQAAALAWRQVPLNVSFRSGPAVLEAVDRVFAAPAARAGLAAGETTVSHTPHRADAAGLVELWPPEAAGERASPDHWAAPLDRVDMESPRARLAQRVAATIDCWLANGKMLEARGRKIRPGDILVLVRKRTEFVDVLISCLRALAIPVAGADRLVVQDHIAVMDLMTAGDVALLPEDDLSLATLLKSPLVGLGEEALLELAAGRKGSLWAELRRRRGDAAFAPAHGCVAALLARADFARPFDFFAALLTGEGQRGRRALMSRLGPEAGDAIDEFLALALRYEQLGTPSLQGFLAWMRGQSREIKRNMDQDAGEIRIMTVHGAKGLEAPIVILPDTCEVPGARHDGPLLAVCDPGRPRGEPALVWLRGDRETQPETILDAREAVQAAAMAEYRRLLYVAMTRAEDCLYVCGALAGKREAPAEGSWYELIENALHPVLAGAAHDLDGSQVARFERGAGAPAATTAPAGAPPAPGPLSIPRWATQPAPPPPPPPPRIAPSRFIAAEEEALAGAHGAAGGRTQALARGNAVHRLLELLPALAPGERAAAAARALPALAPDLGAAERGQIAAEVLALLARPEMQELFSPASRAEVALAGRIAAGEIGEVTISGQIDRLAITADTVLIADYKSDRAVPAAPGDIAPAYVGQLAAYRLLLEKMFPGKAIRAVIVWTAAPLAMEIPAILLDRAIAAGLGGTAGASSAADAP